MPAPARAHRAVPLHRSWIEDGAAGVCQHVQMDMSSFTFSETRHIAHADLVSLYNSVGWAAYANDPDSLARAVEQSSFVVSVRDVTGGLVGLARVISDDVSICYLQDVLVSTHHQRAGIGRALVKRVLDRYVHVRQKVLLTDDEPSQRAFYESLGFIEGNDFEPTPVRAFVQIGNHSS